MPEQAYEWIEYKVSDGVATITFNAPQFNNALGLKGLQEFLDALYRAEADNAVGAVLVTGRGKAFCAGFNLKEVPVKDLEVEKVAAHFRVFGMTLCADMAVCKDTASFFPAWHTIGIANDATTSYSLAKIVGFRHAMEWMMTNRTIYAKEALEWNVVNRVYDEANFEKNVGIIARELAAGPTHLQGIAKAGFHMGWRQSIEEATEFEIQNVMKTVRHPHFQKTLAKFLSGEQKSNKPQVTLPN
jgi:enoyl-CoA hydratase/carnithine racemase